jgi:hypothetical protein
VKEGGGGEDEDDSLAALLLYIRETKGGKQRRMRVFPGSTFFKMKAAWISSSAHLPKTCQPHHMKISFEGTELGDESTPLEAGLAHGDVLDIAMSACPRL